MLLFPNIFMLCIPAGQGNLGLHDQEDKEDLDLLISISMSNMFPEREVQESYGLIMRAVFRIL